MSLNSDDKEYFRQLSWLYPAEYVNQLKELAQEVLKEQLFTGDRQNIREIVHNIINKINAVSEPDPLNHEYDEQIRKELENSKQAAQAAARDRAEALLKKVSTALSAGQSDILAGLGPDAVVLLVEAVNNPDNLVAETARKALITLEDFWAIDAFCQLWADTRQPDLENILTSKGYLAAKPLALRTLTVLKTGAEHYMLSMNEETLTALLTAVNDADSQIATRATEMLISLTNQRCIDIFCEMALANPDDKSLLSWVISGRYAPAQDFRAAIFYCLTGQWLKYYALDTQPNHPLILKGYSEASKEEKKRFLSSARKEGHSLLVIQTLLNTDKEELFEEITDADWLGAINIATNQQKWSELYNLLFKAPIHFSAEIVSLLLKADWEPPQEEKYTWQKIAPSCPETNPYLFVPDGREFGLITLDETGVNPECLAFHPDGRLIAVGNSNGWVNFWRFTQNGQNILWRSVNVSSQRVTALAFSPNGRWLATAGQEGKVSIWGMPDIIWTQSVRGHTGLVSDLAINNEGEILACSKDKQTSPVVRVWHWNKVFMTNKAQFPQNAFVVSAVHPELKLVLSVTATGRIRSWPIMGGTQEQKFSISNKYEILSMAINSAGNIMAVITANGLLNIWAADNKTLAILPVGKTQPGDSLALSSRGNLAAISSFKNKTITIYNTYWSKPLARATPADRQYAKELAGLPEEHVPQKNVYKFLDAVLNSK